MSRQDCVNAHSLYLRTCAGYLRTGDKDARHQAAMLLLQARRIDRKAKESMQ